MPVPLLKQKPRVTRSEMEFAAVCDADYRARTPKLMASTLGNDHVLNPIHDDRL